MARLALLIFVPTAMDPVFTATTESETRASSLARLVRILDFSRIPFRILKGALGFCIACPESLEVFSSKYFRLSRADKEVAAMSSTDPFSRSQSSETSKSAILK